jgi:hypothetical protein
MWTDSLSPRQRIFLVYGFMLILIGVAVWSLLN